MADSPGLTMVRLGRFVYVMCIILQMTVFPIFPLTDEGKADREQEPSFVSPLQVVIAVIGKQAASENPEIISALLCPGAMAREAANIARCELNIGDCNKYPMFDWIRWNELSKHPSYAPEILLDALQASYPNKVQELFAGCIFAVTSALVCVFCSTKVVIIGVGVSIYAAMSEGLKLAPWVGVLVSVAMLAAGLLDIKPQVRSNSEAVAPAKDESKKDK